jgi:cell division septum initiation protein DivIVA
MADRQKWTDERIDDFLDRYVADRTSEANEHNELRKAINELRRDMRAQTVQIIIALIAAAATIIAALIAKGGI